MKLAGIDVGLRSAYVLSPLYIDNSHRLTIGHGVFINKCVVFEGDGYINIGNNCQIGPRVSIVTTNHDVNNNMKCFVKDVVIKDNVWIGAGSIILPGVTIGPNVTIGAGSIVTKDYKNCVIMGNASKKISL